MPAEPVYLLHASMRGVAPFDDLDLSFAHEDGSARLMTAIEGGPGVGKTALLTMIAAARPGHAIVPMSVAPVAGKPTPFAACSWHPGIDDPERPHPLRTVTPNTPLSDKDDDAVLRRREQSLFDRRAKQGGFVFLAFPSTRWFSRQPVTLHAPLRSVGRYDVRATTPLDDANRYDLTRDTKMALAYAGIASALVPASQRERAERRAKVPRWTDMRKLGTAMHEVVDAFAQVAGFGYVGLDPSSVEPLFSSPADLHIPFDALPTQARHLVAIAAITIRTLWAAYPGRDPREMEGVVAIDEVDLHQDPTSHERLVATLRQVLPRIQWILTSSSPALAACCEGAEVVALRRMPSEEFVGVFVGASARTH
jgi:hypothetical protein